MSDLGTRLRDYVDGAADPITLDEVVAAEVPLGPPRRRRPRPLAGGGGGAPRWSLAPSRVSRHAPTDHDEPVDEPARRPPRAREPSSGSRPSVPSGRCPTSRPAGRSSTTRPSASPFPRSWTGGARLCRGPVPSHRRRGRARMAGLGRPRARTSPSRRRSRSAWGDAPRGLGRPARCATASTPTAPMSADGSEPTITDSGARRALQDGPVADTHGVANGQPQRRGAPGAPGRGTSPTPGPATRSRMHRTTASRCCSRSDREPIASVSEHPLRQCPQQRRGPGLDLSPGDGVWLRGRRRRLGGAGGHERPDRRPRRRRGRPRLTYRPRPRARPHRLDRRALGVGVDRRGRGRVGAPGRSCDRSTGCSPRRLGRQLGAAATSSRPWVRVFQERVAHLMRTGNLTTPRSASRSPSLTSGSRVLELGLVAVERGLVDRHHRLEARVTARASSTLLPFTAADIIDADDWLIEQPWPVMRMSEMVRRRRRRGRRRSRRRTAG